MGEIIPYKPEDFEKALHEFADGRVTVARTLSGLKTDIRLDVGTVSINRTPFSFRPPVRYGEVVVETPKGKNVIFIDRPSPLEDVLFFHDALGDLGRGFGDRVHLQLARRILLLNMGIEDERLEYVASCSSVEDPVPSRIEDILEMTA